MDAFTAQALDMITSPKAREAFDLSREPDKVRERYGGKDDKYIYGNDPKPTVRGRPRSSCWPGGWSRPASRW